MLEGAMILVLTVVLVLVVATGVVAVLALSRRSADDWKGVIKREGEEIREDVKTHSLPKRASSSDVGPLCPHRLPAVPPAVRRFLERLLRRRSASGY